MSFTEYRQIEQSSPEWFDQRRGLVTASIMGHLITRRTITSGDVDCPNCHSAAGSPCTSARTGNPLKTNHPDRAAAARNTTSTPILEPASNDTSRGIIASLAGERISGLTDDIPMTAAMYRGIFDEPIARDVYRNFTGYQVRETGFMTRTFDGFTIGYSPDGVVGDDGLLEIKSRSQRSHVRNILAGIVPPENMAQLQVGLLVSGREWIDYVDYTGGMHLWIKRVFPDREWQRVIVETARTVEANITETVRQYTEAVDRFPLTERVEEMQEITL